MGKWLMALPPVLFLALAGMFWLGMQRQNAGEVPSVFVGQPAPPLGGDTLPGIPGVTAAALTEGRVTVVNFWASWCPPCRAEHPTLIALRDEGVRVVGVNMLDKVADATGFLAEHGNPFAGVVYDPRGKTRLDWGVTAPPETFILAADGTVLYRFIGPMVGDDYQQRFRPELDKALKGG